MLMRYARVSTVDRQNTAVQVEALKRASVDRVFEDHASGGRWDRPELHRMLDFLREGGCGLLRRGVPGGSVNLDPR